MHFSKVKAAFQRQQRQFKVIVETDAELVFSDKENTLFSFDAWVCEDQLQDPHSEVFVGLDLWDKRRELFRAGHRLVLIAWTDGVSPILYATDAWFDRHRPG